MNDKKITKVKEKSILMNSKPEGLKAGMSLYAEKEDASRMSPLSVRNGR